MAGSEIPEYGPYVRASVKRGWQKDFDPAVDISLASPPVLLNGASFEVPGDFDRVCRYIELNREAMLKHWEQEVCSGGYLDLQIMLEEDQP